jgi:hypothetical protein
VSERERWRAVGLEMGLGGPKWLGFSFFSFLTLFSKNINKYIFKYF